MIVNYIHISIFGISLTAFVIFLIGIVSTVFYSHDKSECYDPDFKNTLYAERYGKEMKCWSKKTHDKVVYYFIDALRYDVAFEDIDKPGYNCMNNLKTLGDKEHTHRYHNIAHGPTTTAQRVKAIFTGVIPFFIEVIATFGLGRVKEDSLPRQIHLNGGAVDFAGDNIFKARFGEFLNNTKTAPSYNQRDNVGSDKAIDETYMKYMKEYKNDLIVFHTVGADHTSHNKNTFMHEKVCEKLKDNDKIATDLYNMLPKNTLYIVAGDHGMNKFSNHAGFTPDEINGGILLHSTNGLGEQTGDKITQIDITSTMALILGVPIPFANLGVPIRPVFLKDKNDISQIHDYVNALNVTTIQMMKYMKSVDAPKNVKERMGEFEKLMKNIVDEEKKCFNDKEKLYTIMEQHEKLLHEFTNYHYDISHSYDPIYMLIAYAILTLVTIMLILSYYDIELDIHSFFFLLPVFGTVIITIILSLIFNKNILFSVVCGYTVVYSLTMLVTMIGSASYPFSTILNNNFVQHVKAHIYKYRVSYFGFVYFIVVFIINSNLTFIYNAKNINFWIYFSVVLALALYTTTRKARTKRIQPQEKGEPLLLVEQEHQEEKEGIQIEMEINKVIDDENIKNVDNNEQNINFDQPISVAASTSSNTIPFSSKLMNTFMSIYKKIQRTIRELLRTKFGICIPLLSCLIIAFLSNMIDETTEINNIMLGVVILLHFVFKMLTQRRKKILVFMFAIQALALFVSFIVEDSKCPLILYFSLIPSFYNYEALHTTLLYIAAVLQPYHQFTIPILMMDVVLYLVKKSRSSLAPIIFSIQSLWMFKLTLHDFDFSAIHWNSGFIGINGFSLLGNSLLIVFDTLIFIVIPIIQSYIVSTISAVHTVTMEFFSKALVLGFHLFFNYNNEETKYTILLLASWYFAFTCLAYALYFVLLFLDEFVLKSYQKSLKKKNKGRRMI